MCITLVTLHTAVLSSKGSADITQSDLGDEIPVKNTEETPMVGRNCLLVNAISITLITHRMVSQVLPVITIH